MALYSIAHTIGWFEPKETVQGWLEMLRANNSNFSTGVWELLIHLQYQDEWSVERIHHHLATQDNAILCGLAHAASHLWFREERSGQVPLLPLPPHPTRCSKCLPLQPRPLKLDSGMLKIIQFVRTGRTPAANDLTEIIEAEELVDTNPDVVVESAKSD